MTNTKNKEFWLGDQILKDCYVVSSGEDETGYRENPPRQIMKPRKFYRELEKGNIVDSMEISKKLGISRRTLYRYMKENPPIPNIKEPFGDRYYFKLKDVRRWLDKNKKTKKGGKEDA